MVRVLTNVCHNVLGWTYETSEQGLLLGKYTGLIHSVQSPAVSPTADCGDDRSCVHLSKCESDLSDLRTKWEQHLRDHCSRIQSEYSTLDRSFAKSHLSSQNCRLLIGTNSHSETFQTTHLRILQPPTGFQVHGFALAGVLLPILPRLLL